MSSSLASSQSPQHGLPAAAEHHQEHPPPTAWGYPMMMNPLPTALTPQGYLGGGPHPPMMMGYPAVDPNTGYPVGVDPSSASSAYFEQQQGYYQQQYPNPYGMMGFEHHGQVPLCPHPMMAVGNFIPPNPALNCPFNAEAKEFVPDAGASATTTA